MAPLSGHRVHRHTPPGERIRASIAISFANARTRVARPQELARVRRDLGQRLGEPQWLLRVGCALGAVALLLVVIVGSSSPKAHPAMFAGNASRGSALTTSPITASTPAVSTPASTGSKASRDSHSAATPVAKATTMPPAHPATGSSSPQTVTVYTPKTDTVTVAAPSPHSGSPSKSAASKRSTDSLVSSSSTSRPKPADSTGSRSGAATLPAGLMTATAFARLRLNHAKLASITSRLGQPATSTQLQDAFGANYLQTLLQFEPVGESCVWYLDSDASQSTAFQLCFNGANVLVDAQQINMSAASSG